MNSQLDIDNIRVASTCSADWSSMTGDERSRFCGQCHLNVYNLSNMTRSEAARLIREKEGNLCVRYYRRQDGTVLTKDCPVGIRQKARRAVVRSVACISALLGAILTTGAGCSRTTTNDVTAVPTATTTTTTVTNTAVTPVAVEPDPDVHSSFVEMGDVIAVPEEPEPAPPTVHQGRNVLIMGITTPFQ